MPPWINRLSILCKPFRYYHIVIRANSSEIPGHASCLKWQHPSLGPNPCLFSDTSSNNVCVIPYCNFEISIFFCLK
uniref:Uncharacterized protein n=1 Tax=Anguilla anguilla TaxID=7936 RepID=A0A0E9SDF9_ANGAN